MRTNMTSHVDGDTIRYAEDNKEFFSIKEKYLIGDKSASMELNGELRSDLRDEFADEMLMFLLNGMDLTIDMASVTYISKTCQMEIVSANRKKKESGARGKLTIINVPQDIYSEFEKIHLTKTVRIFKQGGKG